MKETERKTEKYDVAVIGGGLAGICCAIMPLNNGLEALSDNLEILPIAETQVDSQLALIMRQQEPVSTLAEKCFAEAQGIFG